MVYEKKLYTWFYDTIQSRYYDLLMKWCFLPLGGEHAVRRTMLEAVDLQPGERVLDMCCGTGNTTFAIAEKAGEHARITAIDLSFGQMRVAKRKNQFPTIEFAVMDASQTCFAEEEFDRVVIPHAIHEMPRAKRLAVLREAWRILKETGTVAVLEVDDPPNPLVRLLFGFWWFYWLPFNFETPTRRDMLRRGPAEEVREAGFRNVVAKTMYRGVLQVVIGQK